MASFFARLVLYFAAAATLCAHAISVSVSEGRFDGQSLQVSLRVPRYEAEHLLRRGADAAAATAAAFRFTGATLSTQACRIEAEELLCDFRYNFSEPVPERVAVEVTLARVTVPNHVHILRLKRGNVERQAIFDRTFERDTIDFRQPSAVEAWSKGMRLGAAQLLYQPVLLLLLLTIALLSAPWPYILPALAAFLVVLPDRFYATPGFFELAASIGIAYLAAEKRFFPDAPGRWIAIAIFGALEGTALAILARPAASAALSYGFGNLLLQALLLLAARILTRYLPEAWRPHTYLLLAAFGVAESVWIYFSRF